MKVSRPALVALLPCVLVLIASSVPGEVRGQEEIFARGNQLYQEGDFEGAIEAYEAVRTAGFEGAALHYNLGNAYFKAGDLGRSILEWERALALAPGDADALANLELARSLTADAVEPLPRFWLFSAVSWWVRLLPRGALMALVTGAWLLVGAGLVARILGRGSDLGRLGTGVALVGAVVVIVFGANLVARELRLGQPERGVILVRAVPVRSAPAAEDDLTLFEIHEGTSVRVEQRTGAWAEVVLDDGKVGWVPADVFETI